MRNIFAGKKCNSANLNTATKFTDLEQNELLFQAVFIRCAGSVQCYYNAIGGF